MAKRKREIKPKISKTLKWTEKYLNRAWLSMPGLIKPSQIRSYKPTLTKIMRSLGSCSFSDKVIAIATHQTKIKIIHHKKERVIVLLSKADILLTIAHEIAHLQYENHGYEHKSYARTIFNAFGLKDVCPHCKGKGKVLVEYKD